MTKAIIFDLGGVVLTHTVEVTMKTLAEIFDVNQGRVDALFKKYEDEWVTGKMTADDLAKIFNQKFKSKLPLGEILKHWKDVYTERTEVNRELIKLIGRLRKKYKVYLLTNTTDIHHNLNLKRGVFGHFDRVFASFIVGKRKPNADFYLHVLEEINLRPQECIFIDDRKENVKGAKSLKMKTILFKDTKHLVRSLKRLGVQV